MNTTARTVPRDAYTAVQGREILGIVLHHTAGTSVPTCRRGASWHYCVRQDGHVYADVEERYAAHHVAQADRWRPPWLRPAPPNAGVSDVNCWTIGVELVYAPQDGQVPTAAQHAALQDVLRDLDARYGRLPIVGHGQLQRDRWETEPHGLDWWRVGLVQLAGSWWLEPIAPEPSPQPPETAPGDDMATIAELQGIITEYAKQVEDLRKEIAGQDSALGALRVNVLAPLEAELASVKQELAACQAAAQTMPGVTHITLEGAVHLADGTRVVVPVRS